MSGDRRSFLRQLCTLPLIGGGVTLLGQPTAVAEPVTNRLLDTYEEWIYEEQIALIVERTLAGRDLNRRRVYGTPAFRWHHPSSRRWLDRNGIPPSTRATIVLSAVGCNWRNDERRA